MGGHFHIRDASIDDLEVIVGIYNDSIPGGLATADLEPITVDSRRSWFSDFDPDRRPCWVVEVASEVVGCIYLRSFYGGRPAYDKTAEVSFYLRASQHGKGLGSLLLGKMIEECPRLGVENLLSLVFDHNVASRRLVEKFGFVQSGFFPGIAEIFGEKRGLNLFLLKL